MFRKKLHTFKYFISYLKPHKKIFIFLLFLFLAGGLITFYNPIITKNIVDNGVRKKDVVLVILMLVIQLSLFLGNSLFDLIRNWLMLRINNNFNIAILQNFLLKLMKLPISFFDKKMVGDLQQRINDHYRIQYFFTSNSISFVTSIISFFAYMATLAYFNLRILFILSFFCSIEILWILFFQKKRKELDYAKFYKMGSNQNNVYEIVIGMQEIKLNNAEEKKIAKWYNTQLQLMKLNIDSMKVDQKQLLGSNILDQLQNVIISFIAAYDVINERMSLGMMMSIGVITGQLKGAINQFLYFIRSYQEASISIDRLMEIHEKKNEDEEYGEVPDEKITGVDINSIELKNVSYQYSESKTLALKNICLSVERGKTLAIVGNSGSGKTTLIKLLLKYYKPVSGTISINGNIDLQDISSGWWRNACGTIMQDGYIFSDSIAENIAVNDKTINIKKLHESANIANIYDFIESLPEKWETNIGTNGAGISGGQRQRILIARAVYKNPDILLFDEATSSLDAENEKIITGNIENFFSNKIKIIVAHRFSTIKNADKIIVLDKGEIVEAGNHHELVSLKGKYYKLLSNQLNLNSNQEKTTLLV